jgi:signal transduction histidine kinase
LLLAVCIVVPAGLFGVATWLDYRSMLCEAEGKARATATALREHALKAITTHDILLRELDRRIQGMNWDQIRSAAPALSAEMQALRAALPDVASLALADKDGLIWVSDALHGPGGTVSIAHRDYWQAQRDADAGTFVSRTVVGILTGTPAFAVSRRRTTPDGGFDGTLHAAIDTGYFRRFWAEVLRGGDGAAITLVRNDGTILARVPPGPGTLPLLTPANNTLMRHLAAHEASGAFTAVSTVDGVRRIYAFETVGRYPLTVVYGTSIATELAGWWWHVAVLGAACAAGSLALVLAMLLIMRQMRLLAEEQARRVAIENAALEGQRLELLGQLAAGAAHDFGNVMHTVAGCATLIEAAVGNPARVTGLARLLGEAAGQGQALTRRLLDFVRATRDQDAADGTGDEETAEVARVMANVCALLSETIGARHALDCDITAAGLPGRIRADRPGLEAVIMNLVINARDALPQGGRIMVRTAGERIGQAMQAAAAGLTPGLYARISVADTGTGMTPEVLSRAVEPFFTTKPRGQGTGLGLAGAKAFAERYGGRLHIDSAAGRGTTVTLWLPAAASPGAAPGAAGETPLRQAP